jgi:hypothetical protein
MDFNETLEESLDGLWNNRQFGSISELPRKDYQPYNSSGGYSYPYQAGGEGVFPPSTPGPENTPSIPWPLNTVTDDLSDAFIYTLSAMQKIERCISENPSLNKKQKEALKKLAIVTKDALKRIDAVGKNIITISNLAGPLPSQLPNLDQKNNK